MSAIRLSEHISQVPTVVVVVPVVAVVVVPVVIVVVAPVVAGVEVGVSTGVLLNLVGIEVIEVNGEDIELPEVGIENEWNKGQPVEEHPGVVESLPGSESNNSLGWGEDELVLISVSTIWSSGGVRSSVGLDSERSNSFDFVSVGEDGSDILTGGERVVDLSASNASGSKLLHVVVFVGGLDSHDVVSLEKERDTLHVWNRVDVGVGLELVHASVSAWLEDHGGSSLLKTNGGLLVHVGPDLLSPALEGSLWLDSLLDGVDINNLEFDSIIGLIEIDGPAQEAEGGC